MTNQAFIPGAAGPGMWGSPNPSMGMPGTGMGIPQMGSPNPQMTPQMMEMMRQAYPNLFNQQVSQQQQTMQQPTVLPLNGRLISSEQDVTPAEVPMDGSVSYFPLSDRSGIIAKYWTKEGTIKTEMYTIKEDSSAEVQNGSKDPSSLEEIINKLNSIEDKLNSFKQTPPASNLIV